MVYTVCSGMSIRIFRVNTVNNVVDRFVLLLKGVIIEHRFMLLTLEVLITITKTCLLKYTENFTYKKEKKK